MRHDWLLGMPDCSWQEQWDWANERLAADPVAAAISDEEAEEFLAVSFMVRFMGPGMRVKLSRAFGARLPAGGEKALRLNTVAILRKWKEPKTRELLVWLVPNTGFGRWPAPAEHPEAWTEQLFYDAYHDNLNIVWLVRARRYLGKADDLSGWFDSLASWAEKQYRLWLHIGRIALRRIVYPEAATPKREVAAAVLPQATVADLRQKDKLTGTLRHDVRGMERDRKQLKARARRAEQEAQVSLSQARGEVAAARRVLIQRVATHGQELAAQARRFELELKLLQQRLNSARQEFVQSLTSLANARRNILEGRGVTVTGCQGNEELCRLLIEGLGGSYRPEGGELVLSASAGLAGIERALRDWALQKVLIKCDGLYRRKEGRYGVALSGVRVHVGGDVIFQDTRVVSCGPSAGSLMAEYGAVAMALHWLLSVAPPPGAQVVIWSDCRSLLSRLRRRLVRRKLGCVALDAIVRRATRILQKRGNHVQFRWVPRDEVHAVDRLCDKAYRDLRWYHRRGSKPRAPLRDFLRSTLPVVV